jgi:hypothetical protein
MRRLPDLPPPAARKGDAASHQRGNSGAALGFPHLLGSYEQASPWWRRWFYAPACLRATSRWPTVQVLANLLDADGFMTVPTSSATAPRAVFLTAGKRSFRSGRCDFFAQLMTISQCRRGHATDGRAAFPAAAGTNATGSRWTSTTPHHPARTSDSAGPGRAGPRRGRRQPHVRRASELQARPNSSIMTCAAS